MMPMPRIALVHDWFTTHAGSEKVIEQVLQIYPQAELFSLVDFVPAPERGFLGGRSVQTSFLQKLPFARKHHRQYLALMPLAVEQFDFSGYDLILSNCHAVVKGIITSPDQLHISYVHTPIRYAWDMQHEYLQVGGLQGLKSVLARIILHYLRQWDFVAAQRPDRLFGNSGFIVSRIQKIYRREAQVLYPPVDTDYYTPSPGPVREDFYLAASRLVPYKRMDVIVRAFNALPEKKLIVIGDGTEAQKLRAISGPNITWLGYQPNEVLRDHLRRCKAFVFAAKEDFGIIPIEAQACGAPVIAYGAGGALETVSPAAGLHFYPQTPEALCKTLEQFEQASDAYLPDACRSNAERFSNQRFKDQFKSMVEQAQDDFANGARR